MKFYKVVFFLLLINTSFAQQSIDSILNYTLSYRGLTAEDITIPVNFDKDKSPTNDSKLLLPVIRDIMKAPLTSFGFIDNVLEYKDLDLQELIDKMFLLINYNTSYINSSKLKADINLFSKDPEAFGKYLKNFILQNRKNEKQLILPFSREDKAYLNKYLMSIISETETENGDNSDIFVFNRHRDSGMFISRNTLGLLNKINRTEIKQNSYLCFKNMFELYSRLSSHNFQTELSSEEIKNDNVQGNFLYYSDEDGIRIAIGGNGKNIYNGHFDLIIDTGGDDVYNIDRESYDLFKNNFSCIIDLSGNDFYNSGSNYNLAGSVFSSGFIFDKEGDDTYKGKNVSLGSTICGLGVLYDENGNDIYHAKQFSIGAASFGTGLLVDRNGNDVYIANSYSQGFGMTEGVGAIVDNKGNDNYLIDARSLDIGRYEDHYISMSQGYGLGLRPYYAGGIGLIIEGEGNDFYSTDIFGQGGAYWYALGCIADKSGNDKYNSYQYAQGAGIHLAVGLLKDYEGWDFYTSDGVSQGCGHDLGFGLLYDVKGSDNYSAYSLSQGAGNANGIGMLIDGFGKDGYLNKQPEISRGYGNARRESGSLGIFLDASGTDFYSVGGLDSTITNSSSWGVMNDYYLSEQASVPSGTNYKVPLDSNKIYSTEEYFIMAKTIEPRFSLWQEYGFRKLVEDSINTSEYILKYLDTDDHRAGLVLRNLAFRIGYSMGNLFVEKIKFHLTSMRTNSVFNENQLAYICYLFGETKNPAGKNELLSLTNDSSIRIRSSAVNALGKINIDSSDKEFITNVSYRLSELANENSPYKMFNKDIAFAFRNYKTIENLPALVNLMNYNYFGVRFSAADILKEYGDEYYNFIDDNLILKVSSEIYFFQAFLNSIENISDENFKILYNKLSGLEISEDIIIKMNLIELLKKKINKSTDLKFQAWAGDVITNHQSNIKMKVN